MSNLSPRVEKVILQHAVDVDQPLKEREMWIEFKAYKAAEGALI